MSRTIIINDDGTAFIQNGNKKTEPVIVKLWTIKDSDLVVLCDIHKMAVRPSPGVPTG